MGVVIDVTTLPVESSKTSVGWTAKIDPEASATGATGVVVNSSWLAGRVMLKFVLVAEVSPVLVAIKYKPLL
jgi:hypothetical protein